MRPVLLIICAACFVAVAVTSWINTRQATNEIVGVARQMMAQTQHLQRRLASMITVTYTSTDGYQITVTTNAGDQLDGEPTGLVERQAARVAAAEQQWPKAT